MDIKVAGMLESDYEEMTLYVTALRVGAVALVLDKSTGALSAGTVAEVVTCGFGTAWALTAKDILCGSYDAEGEFLDFTNDLISFVGIKFLDECEDRKILKSFYDYVQWDWDHFSEDGVFAGIIVPDELFDKREQERYRHVIHRSVKRRMYSERQARKKAKGVNCNA